MNDWFTAEHHPRLGSSKNWGKELFGSSKNWGKNLLCLSKNWGQNLFGSLKKLLYFPPKKFRSTTKVE